LFDREKLFFDSENVLKLGEKFIFSRILIIFVSEKLLIIHEKAVGVGF
jgi:hypothetical protein